MHCNIDKRGRVVRLVMGMISMDAAAALVYLMWKDILVSPWWWVAVAAMAVTGVFALYEATMGWCAVRAMGVKTPM